MTSQPVSSRIVDLGPRSMSGNELRELCLDAQEAELEVVGGVIVDAVDIANITIPRCIVFRGTTFDGLVDFSGADTKAIAFHDCVVKAGINGNGATIRGDFNLSGSSLAGSIMTAASESRSATLWLSESSIEGRFLLGGTTITPTTAEDGRPPRAIQADRLRVRGNVRMTSEFTSDGEIRLIGAEVEGSVDLSSCQITSDELALDLAGARIGGTLFILPGRSGRRPTLRGQVDLTSTVIEEQVLVKETDFVAVTKVPSYYRNPQQLGLAISAARARLLGDVDFVDGCTVTGEMAMRGAYIAGHFYLNDTTVSARPDANSIDLRNLVVDSGFRFAGRSGPIRLDNATINGSLELDHVVASSGNEQQRAFRARNLQVQGDVSFNDARFDGLVDFKLCRITGDFRGYGAHLNNPGRLALRLSSATIEGSAFFTRGFQADGTVRLNRSTINGALDCKHGGFRNPGGDAITMFLASVRSGSHLGWIVDGRVDAVGMNTTMLDDDPASWGESYDIRGLTYERLANDEVGDRLAWLVNQESVDSDGFARLADYYRRSGQTEHSNTVQIARRRFLRQTEQSGRFSRLWDRFLDLAVGYGYRSNRMALLLLLLIAVTTVALQLPAANDVMVAVDEANVVFTPDGTTSAADPSGDGSMAGCAGGTVRCFHPTAYAIDTVVPLIDLHQRSTWYPDRGAPLGQAYEIGLYIAVLLGWMASSTFVFGLTQTFGSRDRA